MLITFNPSCRRWVWLSRNVVRRVNDVAQRRARLVMRWETVRCVSVIRSLGNAICSVNFRSS